MLLRALDIFFSGLGILVLSPLFVPIAILLRFTGEGEIFFSQTRVGKDGKMFDLLKFATMLKDSPNMGTGTVTVQGDPRTGVGGSYYEQEPCCRLLAVVVIHTVVKRRRALKRYRGRR